MVGPVQGVNEEEQPEADHGQEMTEDGATGPGGNHVVCDGDGEWRDVEAAGVVYPKATERGASRARNQGRQEIADRVGKQREDDAADDVPRTDIQVGEPSFQEWQDELEDHEHERKNDERVHDERKLGPLQRLAETGSNQYPTGNDARAVPDPEKKPPQPAAQHRPIR